MEADVVVLATGSSSHLSLLAGLTLARKGYGDARVAIRKTLGSKIADQCKPFWGLGAFLPLPLSPRS